MMRVMCAARERSGWASRRGSVAIEYALLLPALLLFVLGVMDVGRLIWTQATLHRAVQAAARCAAVNPSACGSTAAIQNYAVTQAHGLSMASSDFTAGMAACGVEVAAQRAFTLVIPWLDFAAGSGNTITLTARACYPPARA